MKLLARVNLVFQSAAHYLLPYLFDALNKQAFKVVFLHLSVGLIRHQLFLGLFVLLYHVFKLPYQLIIVCLERLDVLDDVIFDITCTHFRLENFSDECLKLHVASRDLLVL